MEREIIFTGETSYKRKEILLKAKPILFNTEMVRAILDGRKTTTRRVLKPYNSIRAKRSGYYQGNGLWCDKDITYIKDYSVSCCWIETKTYIKEYAQYKVGDILYVRETWYYEEHMHDMTASDPDLPSGRYSHRYIFKADCPDYPVNVGIGPHGWKPSIHMPKEAARLFLRVTNVRVERLQDIITGDYKTPININKEGLISSCCFCTHHNGDCNDYISQHTPKTLTCKLLEDFTLLWNSTVKKSDLDRYGWKANPWVWVIEFERID